MLKKLVMRHVPRSLALDLLSAKLSTEKAKMKAIVVGIRAADNNDQNQVKRVRAGVIWGDADFKTFVLDPYCLPLDVAPDDKVAKRTNSIFYPWRDEWEDVDCGPHGCPILEQRILRKYGQLKLIDPDSSKITVPPDQTSFQKERRANCYKLFCILEGFDDMIDDNDQLVMWEPWHQEVAIDKIFECC